MEFPDELLRLLQSWSYCPAFCQIQAGYRNSISNRPELPYLLDGMQPGFRRRHREMTEGLFRLRNTSVFERTLDPPRCIPERPQSDCKKRRLLCSKLFSW